MLVLTFGAADLLFAADGGRGIEWAKRTAGVTVRRGQFCGLFEAVVTIRLGAAALRRASALRLEGMIFEAIFVVRITEFGNACGKLQLFLLERTHAMTLCLARQADFDI